MEADDRAAVAGWLRDVQGRLDALAAAVAGDGPLSWREADAVRGRHLALKMALKRQQGRAGSARGRAGLSAAEREHLVPAVGRLAAALRMPVGRDPVRYGLAAELAAARASVEAALARLGEEAVT